MTESQLQIQCVKWFRWQYPKLSNCLFHVPNGGKMESRKGDKYEKEGVVAGIPDLLFIYRGEPHAIEMKKPAGGFTKKGNIAKKGVVSKAQKLVHADWSKYGKVEVFVCWSFESFQEYIVNTLN